jgi:hypothetical protein
MVNIHLGRRRRQPPPLLSKPRRVSMFLNPMKATEVRHESTLFWALDQNLEFGMGKSWTVLINYFHPMD